MSHSFEEVFGPVQGMAFALGKARNLLTAEIDVALSGTGVTSSQVGALLLLARGVARTPVGLSRLLAVNTGFVTRIVDRLERQDLVRRARNSPDRRVVNLTLTEAGQRLAARIAVLAPAVLNQRLSGFTPHEFAVFCRLLDKLVAG